MSKVSFHMVAFYCLRLLGHEIDAYYETTDLSKHPRGEEKPGSPTGCLLVVISGCGEGMLVSEDVLE